MKKIINNFMKLSYITPTAYIKNYQSQGNFVLALAHLMNLHESNEYERVILDTELPIILDNGLFENHTPEGIDSLITKGLRIRATHFFAPDHLFDKKRTEEDLNHAIYILKQRCANSYIKIAAVVQGETEEEWLEQYDKFQEIPEVDLIGLSILSVPRCFGSWNNERHTKKDIYQHRDSEITPSRIKLLKKLLERGGNNKKCHLLGLGNSYEDVIFAAQNCPFVISNDTSSAFWNGIQGKKILDDGKIEGGKTEVKVNFNFKDATQEQLNNAQYNINKVKNLIV